MLNAVSCITNVSYYSSSELKKEQDGGYCFVETNRVAITRLLSRLLLDRNEEAVVEATRAFGNLSRFKDVLRYMGELKVLDCLVVLLDHSNREIVHTVCGVLMNAALDPSTRDALLAVRPVASEASTDVRSLLAGIVDCAAGDDLEMTLIASKALYNLLLSRPAASFKQDATNLRRVVDEVLSRLSTEGDEDSCRQELRLVLPQLRRSVNAAT